MASTKLLYSALPYVSFLCVFFAVLGPNLRLVGATPSRLDFFKPCDSDGWNRSHHGDHDVKVVGKVNFTVPHEHPGFNIPNVGKIVIPTTSGPLTAAATESTATESTTTTTEATGSTGTTVAPLPPLIATIGTTVATTTPKSSAGVGAAGSGGVVGETKGIRGIPAGLGEVLKKDDSFQIGAWTVKSLSCQKLGSNRAAALNSGFPGFNKFSYPKAANMPRPKQLKPDSSTYGMRVYGPFPWPADLFYDPKFVIELRKVIQKSEAQAWDWTYLGAEIPIPFQPLVVSEQAGILISQGTFRCTVPATQSGGSPKEFLFDILSTVKYEFMPTYYTNCVPQYGYVPIIDPESGSYNFHGKNGAAVDLDITRTSGFVWKGGPKLWVAAGHADDRDIWYNDWWWRGHPMTLSQAWDTAFGSVGGLGLAQNNNDWESLRIHVPAGQSARVYQGAILCGDYRLLGFVVGVRMFKTGTNTCVPYSGSEDILHLGLCNFCALIDDCDNPNKLCNINCAGMNVFNRSLLFY